jgi:PAS domain S-box-containing protein
VLDRNDRFVTRPGGRAGSPWRHETLSQLSGELPDFAELAELLKKQHSLSPDAATQARAREMDAASSNIDAAEALLIAEQLADTSEEVGRIEQHTLDTDAFLHQAVQVTTLTIPSAHWRLVVVQPTQVVHEAVMSVITRVMFALSLVMVLIVGAASVWARSIVLKPIQRLSSALAQAKPGTLLPIQDAQRRDELGLLARIFNTYSSQLAASHDQLRASAKQFKSVTELQHDALMQIDDNGRIRSLNRRGEELFGYQESEVLGQDFLTVLPWDPRVEALAGMEAATQGNRSAKRILQLTAIRRDGGEFPADVSVSYWHGIKGGLYNVQVSASTAFGYT